MPLKAAPAYPAASAHYELAKPGTMRLMPPDDCVTALKTDYVHMKNMIFGEKPEFDEVLKTIQILQNEILQLQKHIISATGFY